MSQSTTPTRPLEGKVVVVTGGNSGIGEGIVREAAAQGAKVVIDWVSNEEATDRIVADVTAAGGQAIGFRADVSKVAELQALADAAVEAYGGDLVPGTDQASREVVDLRLDAAGDDLALGIGGHLARHVDEVARAHRG